MALTEFIPTFRSGHDPDDVLGRNLGIGGILRRIAGVYASATVTVVAGPDSSLTISDVAFDATKARVSFLPHGGTDGGKYKLLLRVILTDGRQFDRSVWLLVRNR